MPASPTLYPGQPLKLRIGNIVDSGNDMPATFIKKPIWKVDREDLLKIVKISADGLEAEFEAQYGARPSTQELVQVSIHGRYPAAAGEDPFSDSFELYVAAHAAAVIGRIEQVIED